MYVLCWCKILKQHLPFSSFYVEYSLYFSKERASPHDEMGASGIRIHLRWCAVFFFLLILAAIHITHTHTLAIKKIDYPRVQRATCHFTIHLRWRRSITAQRIKPTRNSKQMCARKLHFCSTIRRMWNGKYTQPYL